MTRTSETYYCALDNILAALFPFWVGLEETVVKTQIFFASLAYLVHCEVVESTRAMRLEDGFAQSGRESLIIRGRWLRQPGV